MVDLSAVVTFRQHLRSCTACPLHAQCNGPIPWRGDLNPEFAVLGEAPGKTEDARNEPFVGDTGNILSHWLKVKGFDPKAMTYMNAVQCRPVRPNPKPTAAEMKACRGWMHGQLEFIRPKVLITLGVTAFESLIGGRWPELKLVHGKPLMHPTYGCWVWPTYHPSAYLRGRNKTYETKILNDLERLRIWWTNQEGGLDICYICGDELYRYSDWAVGLCYRHSMRAGVLFPEDVGT